MSEQLYAEHPEVYDVLYGGKEYDEEVAFVRDRFEARGNGGDRALVVGCGTGEHSRRLREEGFEVLGVDRYEAMVERARGKSDAEFRVDALPDLAVGGEFDLVWAPFTVVNHLAPDEFPAGVRAMADRLAPGGVLVCDTLSVPDEETPPRLYTHEGPDGEYARLVQTHALEDGRHRWDSLVFTPGGDFFVDTHRLTNYSGDYVAGVLEGAGLDVERHDWYDLDEGESDQEPTVFVAVG